MSISSRIPPAGRGAPAWHSVGPESVPMLSAAAPPLVLRNGEAAPLDRLPRHTRTEFRERILTAVGEGARISALFGAPLSADELVLIAVLARDDAGTLELLSCRPGGGYASLTNDCPEAHLFEREVWEQWGIEPLGHPWLKPVRFTARTPRPGMAPDTAEPPVVGVTELFHMDGEEVHEVAVGPVHAGIIEPGHFRFQCHGEHVFHLEISLGYQHRGVERALIGGPGPRTLPLIETLAGDTTVGHATACCQAIEALRGDSALPGRGAAWRAIALELERLANHIGDLGMLANDVAYLPTASFCGRIRGDVLNLTARLCGNRFGRQLVRPGGVGFDLQGDEVAELRGRLAQALKDTTVAIELLWRTASVTARFEDTGLVAPANARSIGLVGPAARASGVVRDVRRDHPCGLWREAPIEPASWPSGDVYGRAWVRWLEIQRSFAWIAERLQALPDGPVRAQSAAPRALDPLRIAVSLVEGWRGEICHVALTDEQGRFSTYKVVDPSFHNWFGLAMSLHDGEISDFPLCNKSFNLSYCGHDL